MKDLKLQRILLRMLIEKKEILKNICYTDLVYKRINKKLSTRLSRSKIEAMIFRMIQKTPTSSFQRVGKNFYISNQQNRIRITINSNTYRVITVDRIN